jgi:hypothetical protein
VATATQVGAHADFQSGIVRAARDEIRAFWRTLPLDDPALARELFMDATESLVDKYGNAAGAAAADFYDELRSDAQVRREFRALVAHADMEAVEGATRRLAGAFFDGNPDAALRGVLAVVDKVVKQVARDTITRSSFADPEAAGYERVTRGPTCAFCNMLASRGAVYAKDTAYFAAHHDCDCAAVPSWDRSAPEVDVQQYEASRRTSTMTPEQREAHREAIRGYIAEHPELDD